MEHIQVAFWVVALLVVLAVLFDRMPLGAPSKLYPVGPFDYDVARDAIRAIYGRGARRAGTALFDLAKTALAILGVKATSKRD